MKLDSHCGGCGHDIELHTLANLRMVDKKFLGRVQPMFQWAFNCKGYNYKEASHVVPPDPCECNNFEIQEVKDGKAK